MKSKINKYYLLIVFATGFDDLGNYGTDVVATGVFVAKEDAEKAGEEYKNINSVYSYRIDEVDMNEVVTI